MSRKSLANRRSVEISIIRASGFRIASSPAISASVNSSGPTGRPASAVNGAVGECERRGQIVGHAIRQEIVHDRQIRARPLFGEPQPERDAAVDHAPHRAATKVLRLEDLERGIDHIDGATWLPKVASTHDLRMQRQYEDADLRNRYSTADKSVTQFGHQVLGIGGGARPCSQPIDDRLRVAIRHRNIIYNSTFVVERRLASYEGARKSSIERRNNFGSQRRPRHYGFPQSRCARPYRGLLPR